MRGISIPIPAWLRSFAAINRRTLTLVVIVAVSIMFSAQPTLLNQFEQRTYDLRFRSRGPLPPSPAVTLAMIDEKSLDRLGRWPWPRARFAELIDRVNRDGAKVIAFDIGFLEPDENSQLQLLDDLTAELGQIRDSNPHLSAYLTDKRRHADNDRLLADAIRSSSASVVLGYFFHMLANPRHPLSEEEIAEQYRRIAGSQYPLVTYRGGNAGAMAIPRAYAPESNLPVLTEAAASSGYFSVKQDSDGTVRWMPLAVAGGEEMFPPLSVLAAWHYLDRPPMLLRVGPYGVEGVQVGSTFAPTDESGRLLVNYLGPPGTFPQHSIADILDGSTEEGAFRDKIVLVGAAATGIYDMRTTPFSPVHPGIEIHASVIDNLLTGRFIARPGWSETYDVFAIAILSIVAALGLWRLSPLPSIIFCAALFALHVFVAREVFVRYGLWLNAVYPLLALVATYLSITVYEFVSEQRERRRLRNAFGQYVASEVVETIVRDPDKLQLGGEEKVLTVLFSDLKGFTSYSERYTPQQMIELLSEYYARMTERVFGCGGTLKEYVGDEMMAIFGAPIDQADHAVRACAAALDMRAHRHALSEEWVSQGRPRLYARTGINSGRMLVGNLGSKYRFSYGVLGDNVNLGSRLEGLNKEYATEILVGENTVKLLGDEFLLREVDVVRVVGKEKPTRLYELLAAAGAELPASEARAMESYSAGLAAYREQRWDDALRQFHAALEQKADDGPSLVMIERSKAYMESPPGEEWDGVFVATRK
jgi:adenylate cyclase